MTTLRLSPLATRREAALVIVDTVGDVTHDPTPRILSMAALELVTNLDTIRRDLDGYDEDERRDVADVLCAVVRQRLVPEDVG